MDNEKKKRQKKKKNKQGKTNDRPPTGAVDLVSENNNHAIVNNQNLNSENTDFYNKQRVVDSDRESISGAETSISVDSNLLNREASLEQKIKELQEQLEVHVLREADLERNILQSQKERDLWNHKETEFETRILHLQTEKDSWLQKEALVASLNKDNARLQAQVMELKEHVSNLQSKIHDLENSIATNLSSQRTKHVTENEEMNSQLESSRALIEKLVSENEKLIENVNNLNADLDQKSVMVTNSEFETSATETDPIMPSSPEKVSVSDKIMESVKNDVVKFKSNNSVNDLNRVSMESGEIVQISLDENDVITGPTSTNIEKAKAGSDPVPLTDAPLIGAPFRFISLVARYVSGADLVEKS
ncbi:hypothetical protein L2E82_01260 [Cichorium intybus]|uniref:Uncharacterized protein n=1 Tax=Cichorium intybus TaxID=13427 RepID=A0ACB9GYT7_CICIN|nr:hypothetical protein L2E82_01260 [Cichorium intybus]